MVPTTGPTVKKSDLPTITPNQDPTQAPTVTPSVSPTAIPTPEPTSAPKKGSDDLSGGAIAGIVIGGIVFTAAAIYGAMKAYKLWTNRNVAIATDRVEVDLEAGLTSSEAQDPALRKQSILSPAADRDLESGDNGEENLETRAASLAEVPQQQPRASIFSTFSGAAIRRLSSLWGGVPAGTLRIANIAEPTDADLEAFNISDSDEDDRQLVTDAELDAFVIPENDGDEDEEQAFNNLFQQLMDSARRLSPMDDISSLDSNELANISQSTEHEFCDANASDGDDSELDNISQSTEHEFGDAHASDDDDSKISNISDARSVDNDDDLDDAQYLDDFDSAALAAHNALMPSSTLSNPAIEHSFNSRSGSRSSDDSNILG